MTKFYNKLFKDLNTEELKQAEGKYFICLHSPQYSSDLDGYQSYFKYLVIREKEFISRFMELEKAKEYVQIMNELV